MTVSPTFAYVLRLADDALVLGHRLSEWAGRGPTLEEDLALANLALDLIGQARALYAYAADLEGAGRTEDDLAYLRAEGDYRNLLLCEQPNGDFAQTIVRHALFAAFMVPFWRGLIGSKDGGLAAVAAKAEKEALYHLRHAGEWLVRLGDGTETSRGKAMDALGRLWPFTGELFEMDDAERALVEAGVAVDRAALKPAWEATIGDLLAQATLPRPRDGWMQSGGRHGVHTEHLGRVLAELQYLQRAHPGARW